MARTKGAKNLQRTPEQMAALKQRKEQRRALKAAAKARGNGVGDNAQSLSDDQERALHYIHVGEYEAAQAAVKSAIAKRKTTVARIRSEGGNLDQVKASIKLQTPEGETEVVEDIRRKSQAARWAGVGLQLDLFDQARADATQQYERGKTAGLQGLTPDGDVSQDWMTGWHAGQEALAATLELFRREPTQQNIRHEASGERPDADRAVDEVEEFDRLSLQAPSQEEGDSSEATVPWVRPSEEDDLTEGEV